jgi:hypothetical protein
MRRILDLGLAGVMLISLGANLNPSEAKGGKNCSGGGKECGAGKNKKHCAQEKQMKAQPYLVKFNQQGGIAATFKGVELNTAKLSCEDACALVEAIKKSGILKESTLKSTNPHAADVFYYDIIVEEKNRTHHVTFDDTTVPDSYRPLVEFLRTRATDMKPPMAK